MTITAAMLAQRLCDVAAAVAVLLLLTLLLMRLVRQPAKRLWLIQWALLGGLLLLPSIFVPGKLVTLALLNLPEQEIQGGETHAPSRNQPNDVALPNLVGTRTVERPPRIRRLERNATHTLAHSHPAGAKTAPMHAAAPSARTIQSAARDTRIWWKVMLAAYGIGVATMLVRLAIGQWCVHRLVRRASPAAPTLEQQWQSLLASMQRTMGIAQRRTVRLLVSHHISSPVAVGVWRPAVLLPERLADEGFTDRLRPILAHEAAHVLRKDARLRLIAALFQVVHFYQPAYWLLRRELDACQEYLADSQAAAFARSAADYAEQLIDLWRAAPADTFRQLGTVGIVEGRSQLFRRTKMLLDVRHKLDLGSSLGFRVSSGLVTVALAQMLGLVTLWAAAPPQSPRSAPAPWPAAAIAEPAKPQPSEPGAVPMPAPSLPVVRRIARVTAAGETVDSAANQQWRIRLVDARGAAVKGAKVRRWAAGLSSGGSIGLEHCKLPALSSDNKGVVTVSWPPRDLEPSNLQTAKLLNQLRLRSLALEVDHPDYPIWSNYVQLGGEPRIVLADSTTLTIRARRHPSVAPADAQQEKQPDPRDLYPISSGPALNRTARDGEIILSRVDMTKTDVDSLLRIVELPKDTAKRATEDEGIWFSELVNLEKYAGQGNAISLSVELRPAVRLKGTLADSVPRPVTNGRVVATVVAGTQPRGVWQFAATADINPDGTFVLNSLPPHENLQLIAHCDGWISRSPSRREIGEYTRRFPVPGAEEVAGIVCPQLVRIESGVERTTVPMLATSTAEITVLDETGKPLPDATVAFFPNQYWYNVGTNMVGDGGSTLAWLRAKRDGKADPAAAATPQPSRYQKTTDARGVAVVTNLPGFDAAGQPAAGGQTYRVSREGYVLTANQLTPMSDAAMPLQWIATVAGQTARTTVRMHKALPPADAANDAAENELAGRVVDENGVGIEGVEVHVWERDNEKIRTDRRGQFRHKFTPEYSDEAHLLVRFKKPGLAPHLVPDWPLGVKRDVVVVLSNKTYFEGLVRRPDGTPASAVLVRANQGPKDDNQAAVIDEIWTETRTGADGRYKLLLQPDSYVIEIRAPGVGAMRLPRPGDKPDGTSIVKGQSPESPPRLYIMEREAKTLDIDLETGVDFRAEILDSVTGKPVPNVRLWHWQYPGVEGRSDVSGSAVIPTMQSGNFTFMIDAPGYLRGLSPEIPARLAKMYRQSSRFAGGPLWLALDEGVPFDLTPGMKPVTITLEPAVTITGRVVDPDGKPVKGATVASTRSGTGSSITGDTRYTKQTGADGTFAVVLPPSDKKKYNLLAHDGAYREWRHWANGAGPPLATKAGQKIEGVELRLNRPGKIRGRIVDAEGKPLAKVYVRSSDVEGMENNYFSPATRSDRDGRFELPYVRPGKHIVHGWMSVDKKDPKSAKLPVVDVQSGKVADAGDFNIPAEYREQP